MTVDIRNPQGRALSTADRSSAVAESLRQIARASRFTDRKKGIRAYQSHVKHDPWTPVLFVVLCLIPTLAGALYYGLIAADRYVTEARFAIRPALGAADKAANDEVGTGASGIKQLVIQDTLITLDYIESRPMVEAMERLMPLRTMFSREGIDFVERFDPEKPIEKLVKYWGHRVKASVEQNSGIITLTVNAFDAQESLALTRAVVAECERMVNELTMKMREDAVAESRRELTRAEERMTQLRYAVRDLRNHEGVLDAEKTNEANLKVVAELRKARIELAVQLALGQRDLGPESRRILDLKTQIANLDDNIERIERETTNQDPARRKVLVDAMTQFEAYANARKNAETYYAKVLSAYERARIIAARQIEFFSPVVAPVLAQSPEQPRRILMVSLITAGSALLFALGIVIRRYAT